MIYKLIWKTKGGDKAFQISDSFQCLSGIKQYLIDFEEIPEIDIKIVKEE